ncbi:ABC transporter ATP-binding protein [Bacillus solitudinis]|uniref:ABC transporter ATP-binding protein n=1 Tax=Bacillus solitudinis TaxID=2014074 RepID=UPI000C246EC3|nr:ABC transporter ATP-binding protein [Bacillus solitudinis]
MNKSVISLDNIVWQPEENTILNQVTWQVNKGEHWVVLGLNGSGKTSLLQMVTGYLWPTKGRVQVLGEIFGQVNIHEIRKKIGWVSASLDERFLSRTYDRALDVVMSGKYASVGLYEQTTIDDEEKAYSLLKQLKINHLVHQRYIHLSQGEKRRVIIARALMAEPKLLILDEPCNGLDVFAREQLLETIQELASTKEGPTLIYVTHHIEEVVPAISHALLLRDGFLIKAGCKKETLSDILLQQTFQVPLTVKWEGDRPWLQIRSENS